MAILAYAGSVIDSGKARAFAEAWVSAWNSHDIDEIMMHYADPPEHVSPLIVERLGRADGSIRDLSELREYFLRGLTGTPPLRFELCDVFAGVTSVAISYRNHRDVVVLEAMHFDGAGKVARSIVHHRPA